MSIWFARYRWIFLVLTVLLLSFAYYKTYKNKKNCSPWSLRILHGTTVLSLGLILYSFLNS